MATARIHLESIVQQAASIAEWNDAQLVVVRDRLETIDRSMPSFGDFVCKHCTQRLEITALVVTRDSRNAHCARSTRGHEAEFV